MINLIEINVGYSTNTTLDIRVNNELEHAQINMPFKWVFIQSVTAHYVVSPLKSLNTNSNKKTEGKHIATHNNYFAVNTTNMVMLSTMLRLLLI